MSHPHSQTLANAASDGSHHSAHDGPHEGPIKTPKQLVLAVVASFVVPIM
jgi:hypothetical protein